VTSLRAEPAAVQNLLEFRDATMCEDLQSAVQDAVGLNDYDSSGKVPGWIRLETRPSGATMVWWTLVALDSGSQDQVYTTGRHTFEFRVSANGKTLWPENGPSDTVTNMGAGCGGGISGF